MSRILGNCDIASAGAERVKGGARSTQGGKARLAARAVLISGNALFREGLRSVLVAHRVRVVLSLRSPRDLTRLDGTPGTSILIDCESESDVSAAADELARLRAANPDARIVVLACQDSASLLTLARLGIANAIVRRDISEDTLIKLLAMMGDDVTILPLGLMARLGASPIATPEAEEPPPTRSDEAPIMRSGRPLSERELAILRCLVGGESNKAIARQLDIAEATVKIHVKGVLRKISVSNRTQAAVWALKHLAPLAANRSIAPSPAPSPDAWRHGVPLTAMPSANEGSCAAIVAAPSV